MKRNIHLQPLSRQHHNGLLAALLLKKGLAKHADPAVMAEFIRDFWQRDLHAHFLAEEQYLVPLAQEAGIAENLNQQLLDEHKQLKACVEQASTGINSASNIEVFATILEAHIRFEERVYFPALESACSNAQMASAGMHLHDHDEANCINYPVKFWE